MVSNLADYFAEFEEFKNHNRLLSFLDVFIFTAYRSTLFILNNEMLKSRKISRLIWSVGVAKNFKTPLMLCSPVVVSTSQNWCAAGDDGTVVGGAALPLEPSWFESPVYDFFFDGKQARNSNCHQLALHPQVREPRVSLPPREWEEGF